jgi:hypothetical protein
MYDDFSSLERSMIVKITNICHQSKSFHHQHSIVFTNNDNTEGSPVGNVAMLKSKSKYAILFGPFDDNTLKSSKIRDLYRHQHMKNAMTLRNYLPPPLHYFKTDKTHSIITHITSPHLMTFVSNTAQSFTLTTNHHIVH